MRLAGEHVVVTGAGGGIGRVVVAAVSRAGAAVSCWDIAEEANKQSAANLEALDRPAVSVACDLTDVDATREAFAVTEATLGPVTGLVAVAGGAAGERIGFLDMSTDDWHRIVDRNLTSSFVTTRVVGEAMAARGRGSIVLFGSQSATTVTVGLSAYSAAKAGIRQLCRAAALELAPHAVRVNAVAPGVTITAANAALLAPGSPEAHLVSAIPLGRAAQPEELVGAVIYLLSGESTFTTGAWIDIDGGFQLV